MLIPRSILRAAVLSLLVAVPTACGGDDDESDGAEVTWEIAQEDLPGALLSVWGTTATDIWAVGSRTGDGPLVLRYDGADWQRLDTSAVGELDLWWVYGFAGGPIYMGGSGGSIVAYEDGEFRLMPTPSQSPTIFGIWGCSSDDVWAVGGQEGGSQGGFAWRLREGSWTEAEGFPAEVSAADAVWKIFGRSCTDVWMVGTAGLAVHWDGASFDGGLQRVAGGSLFTVHANSERFVAVGGAVTPLVVENDGDGWANASPTMGDGTFGVCLTEDGGYASGTFGSLLRREDGAWVREDNGLNLDQTLHSVWIDPAGGVWAAGGQVLVEPYDRGVLIHKRDGF